MSFISSRTLRLILVLVLLTGCNSKSTTSTAGSGEDGEGAATGGAKSKNRLPVKQNVKEIAGNWVVVVTTQQNDNYRWLIRFNRGADGKYAAEFLDAAQDKDAIDKSVNEKPDVTETEVDGDDVRFTAKLGDRTFNFAGLFHEGFIRGTIQSSPFEIFLARLLPTDEKTLAAFNPVGLPPGHDVFANKVKSKDFQPEEFVSTVNEFRTSPLAQDMYSMLMSEHARAKFSEAKVKEVIEAFLSSASLWGKRWEARANLTIAVNLLKGHQFPRMVSKYLDDAEKKFGKDLPAFQEALKNYRDTAEIQILIQDLANSSSTEQVQADASARLTEYLKKQPFNPEILFALASDAEKNGKGDAAIEYFSDIVALPLLEMHILAQRTGNPPDTAIPSESLKKLWAQKHGDDSDFQKHVDDVYHDKVGAFLDEIRKNGPPAPENKSGKKTVLVEFFTGMMCQPCTSADLALSALTRAFPSSDVIVTRYHQHIPRPDGLVNQDSEERAAFYQISSTPMIVVDGQMMDPQFYAGPMQMAPNGYGILRRVIDPLLVQKSEIALQLSASVMDGQLTISVEATGVAEDLLPSCRLRMAIVENLVHTQAPLGTNGIREHENVIREMPGQAKGIPPKNGELKYSLTMPIADIQRNVVEHISRFEAGRRGEFPAEIKPPIRGPLSLVAWVQNGNPDAATNAKLVLQSAIVPITGETGFGIEPAAEVDPKAIPKAEEIAAAATAAGDVSETTPPAPPLPE